MDILKIRKKAQEAKEQGEPADGPSADVPATDAPEADAPDAVAGSEQAVAPEPSAPPPAPEPAPAYELPPAAPEPPPELAPPAAAEPAPESSPLMAGAVEDPTPLPEEGPITSSASAEELAAKFAQTRMELREHDPLGYFLTYYDAELADDDGEEKPAFVNESSQRRFLAFDLAHEAYAVSILDVGEILKTYAVTQVPRAPRSVLGVLSKRGVVMPVIDLAAALGLREPDDSMRGEQRILVVGDGDEVVGLRVDRVHAVVQIPSASVEGVPGGLGARSAHLLSGLGRVGGQLYILLDVTAFLGHLHGSIEPEPVVAGGVA